MYVLTFHNNILKSILQLDAGVMKDFLQVGRKGSQCIKVCHCESVMWTRHVEHQQCLCWLFSYQVDMQLKAKCHFPPSIVSSAF